MLLNLIDFLKFILHHDHSLPSSLLLVSPPTSLCTLNLVFLSFYSEKTRPPIVIKNTWHIKMQ